MKLKQVAKHELRNLDTLSTTWQSQVEAAVSKYKDEHFKFFSLPDNERYRLLRLRVWVMKYNVDLSYILEKLLPFWQQWIRSKSKRVGQGLGVRIATLTGKKSEQILKDAIKKDFPSEQHIRLSRSFQQERILDKALNESEDGIKVADVSKNLFDFLDPKSYLRYYRRRLRRQRSKREAIIQNFKERPYRGNPFL